MKSLSIKSRITIVSAIAVTVIGYVAIDNYVNLKKLATLAAETQKAGTMLRQHLDGDMMHDAIRADVLKAHLGLKADSAKMIEEAKAEAIEHGARFMDNLHKNQSLDLPPHLHSLFVEEEPSLGAYRQMANNYITVALEDAKKGTSQSELLMPEFEKTFKVLEGEQSAVSDKVEAYSAELKSQQAATASTALIHALVGAIFAILASLLVPFFSRRTLFAPLEGLIVIMGPLAKGDWNVAVTGTERKDEIGEMARAVAVFKTGGMEAERLRDEQLAD